MMTTQTAVRAAFWEAHPNVACKRNRAGYPLRQNLQPVDTRVAFVDYVDSLARSGAITERLAERVVL